MQEPMRRWCRGTLLGFFTLLILLVLTVVLIDPYEIYHKAFFYVPLFRSETQSYSNAGVAKSFDYDSCIIGSSVTENSKPSLYEAALGGSFVKLCMNGGTAMDHAKMLEIAFRRHTIRRVVYGIDVFAYPVYWTNQKMRTPDYLYDENIVNDVYYWFNHDVIFEEIPGALRRIGIADEANLRDWMYAWDPPELPSPSDLQVKVVYPPPAQHTSRMELIDMNIEHNLIPFIESHPETQFELFFPPYSLSYWRNQLNHGDLEADLECRDRILESVIDYPNVRIYDFTIKTDWITDYSHYYDYRHYTSVINDAMAQAISDGVMQVHSAEEGFANTRRLRELTMDQAIP